ncbi:Uncharacterized protein Adt_19031 [Abeliophyllum distichum]|uniref:Uncharacterized protein n=1 Tax=Abeliophyllum distichum TaxID=126358 RepID=A0ABD1TL18_9LAMI
MRIYSSYEVDLKSICIDSNSIGLSLDGGNLGFDLSEQSHLGAIDILFTWNIPGHLKDIDLIRIRDDYGVSAFVQLCLPPLQERVSGIVSCWTFFYELPFKDGF